MKIDVKRLPHAADLPLPAYATEGAAGMDLMAAIDSDITLSPGEILAVPTGLSIALPKGAEAQVRPRSGLALKSGVTVLNAPGTIDCDYRGEIKVILINHSKVDFLITRGLRIAQMVVASYTRIDWHETSELDATERAEGGFGSTGLKAGRN